MDVTFVQSPLVRQQAPIGGGHGLGVQDVPSPWYEPPSCAHWLEVTVTHKPSATQQAPTGVAEMKSTRKAGRRLVVAISRVSKRREVFVVPSPPRISQPKLVPGLFSHNCTSATMSVEDHVKKPSRSLTVVVALALARKSPPAVDH